MLVAPTSTLTVGELFGDGIVIWVFLLMQAFVLLVHLLKANDGEEELATDASSIASPHQPATPKHLGGSGSLTEDGRGM